MKKIINDLVRSKKLGWTVLRIQLLMVIVGYGSLMIFENKLIFFPHKHTVGGEGMTPPAPWKIDQTRDVRVDEVTFSPADDNDLTLHAWYYSPFENDARVETDFVVIYCHGNAGDVPGRHQKTALICSTGVDVLAFDYRGYGTNAGSPSEDGVCADGRAAYDFLIKRGITPDRIILYGESLGGGVAIDLASKVDYAGLITESTFTSIPDMAAAAYPFVPKFLVRTQLNSLKKIPSVNRPKFFMHGNIDGVIPKAMCDRLYKAANDPKRQHIFPKADHDDVFAQPDYVDVWKEFLEFVKACGEDK
jgi:fermentation-respiration switch protein FrsA (DUF1100 family)